MSSALRIAATVLLLLAGVVLGCEGDLEQLCVSGETRECVCEGDRPGAQMCNADGDAWACCHCDGSGDDDDTLPLDDDDDDDDDDDVIHGDDDDLDDDDGDDDVDWPDFPSYLTVGVGITAHGGLAGGAAAVSFDITLHDDQAEPVLGLESDYLAIPFWMWTL